jgi:hypothetical protein
LSLGRVRADCLPCVKGHRPPSRASLIGRNERGRLGMPELHPNQCACQDCRRRRLIRDDDPVAERFSADELEDFGYVLKRKPAGREDD